MSNKIHFNDLSNYNDSKSFVWTALTYDKEQMKDIEKFLKEEGFLGNRASITDMKIIDGNISGTHGRTDVLFIVKNPKYNPIARLSIQGLTWTSDFINNYCQDYGKNVYREEGVL